MGGEKPTAPTDYGLNERGTVTAYRASATNVIVGFIISFTTFEMADDALARLQRGCLSHGVNAITSHNK